jgi:hypothetical protein
MKKMWSLLKAMCSAIVKTMFAARVEAGDKARRRSQLGPARGNSVLGYVAVPL